VLNNKQQPHEQQPQEEDVLSRVLQSTRQFFAENWLHLILVVAIIGAGIMVWQLYLTRHTANVMAAWNELGGVPASELSLMVEQPQQAEQLRKEAITVTEDILQSSPHSSAAPWALLQLGSLQAGSGDWKAAASSFADLTAGYPKSEPIETARAALATSLESLGEYKKAGDLYQALAGSGQPYHLLSAARCRELSGDLADAKNLYEQLRDTKDGDEDLREIAQARLSDMELGQPLPPPPAAQPQALQAAPAAPAEGPPAAPAEPAAPAAPAAPSGAQPAAPPAPGATQPPAPATPAAKPPAAPATEPPKGPDSSTQVNPARGGGG
jgi:TolA-binding protein